MKKFFIFNFLLIILIGTVMIGWKFFMGGPDSQKHDIPAPTIQASTDGQANSKTIYSWTDKNGVEHITTTPPPENIKIKHKTAFKRTSSEKTESNSPEQSALSKMLKTSPEKGESDSSDEDILNKLQKTSPEKTENDNAEQDTLSRMLKVWQIFKSVVISSK